ncbi:CU044_5270 family protein [Actinomadura livida]|uniref:CU044_5270 family protein n=1 Tax=Actinomadura livida TaxID=79909 RepID=A0A7W7ILH7_9ACTN|nr:MULTISPECIES: CU044_5270 family protein [Actinomadura]MBB4778863.1 hypothetical protein [Actinomadura catellatispora]GGU26313.1 hypothetical protein GCM10010208_58850 [Actinomadura livida]
MDDLQLLGATLTKPEPSAEIIERGRYQLQNAMREPVRRRRAWRPVLAIGVAAATGAAAVAIVTGGGSPDPTREGTATVQMSGPQVLLAAATVAETKPAASGTYWHVKSVAPSSANIKTFESWTTADGRQWVRYDGGALKRLPGRHPITVRGTRLGLAQIAELPTSATELKATLLSSRTAGQKRAQITEETNLLLLLTDLLSDVPAPPKVRAAALRALATLPHVKNLGKVPGGQSLLFAGDGGGTKLVVNPKTSEVNAEGYADVNGKQESMGGITSTSRWTDTLPR